MKKKEIIMALLVSITIFSVSFIVSADSIIESQTTNNSGILIDTDYTVLAQIVDLDDGYTLTKAEIYFNDPSSDADLVQVGVSEDRESSPANWEEYDSVAATLCNGWVEFDFDDYDCTDGDIYLMVRLLDAVGNDWVEVATVSPSGYSGNLYGYDSGWSSAINEDLVFRLYADEIPNEDPEAEIDWMDPWGLQVNFTAEFSTDSDGTITTWWWDWENDGSWDDTSTGETPSHTYPAAGPYTCKLRVFDNDGGWDETTGGFTLSEIGDPNVDPVASFTKSTSGLTVNVDGSGSSDSDGTITGYQWDWTTDGSYDDTGETESHTYTLAGTYNITLRVTDNGSATNTTTQQVTVSAGSGTPSSGFTATDTTTWLIIGGVLAIAIGAIIFVGPTKKGGKRKK